MTSYAQKQSEKPVNLFRWSILILILIIGSVRIYWPHNLSSLYEYDENPSETCQYL